MNHPANEWAKAIAVRLSDEWHGKPDFMEDANLLEEVLTKALTAVPGECTRLIGTGIIEESFFDLLD